MANVGIKDFCPMYIAVERACYDWKVLCLI